MHWVMANYTLKISSCLFLFKLAQACYIVVSSKEMLTACSQYTYQLVFINNIFFNLNTLFLNNYSTVYIRPLHSHKYQRNIQVLHTIYTKCTGGMYTRLLCVPVRLKLTHLATASRVMREVHWQSHKRQNTGKIKQDEIYMMYNYYRVSGWKIPLC